MELSPQDGYISTTGLHGRKYTNKSSLPPSGNSGMGTGYHLGQLELTEVEDVGGAEDSERPFPM